MIPCAKLLTSVLLMASLVLSGSASATTSAASFNNLNAASFSDSLGNGYNDLFSITTSGSDSSSTIGRSSDGNSSDAFNGFGLPDFSHGNRDNGNGWIIGSGFDSDDHHTAGNDPDRWFGFGGYGFERFHNRECWWFRECGRVVNAVPEPSEYALMVLGLGMIGLVAIRRRRGNNR